MKNIRERAKDFGIKTSGMKKLKLIHAIQLEEGNFNCFASAFFGECDQVGCIWKNDCFSAAKKLDS